MEQPDAPVERHDREPGPGGVTRAVSVAEMQRIDAAAIEALGIPRLLLMEHAGLAVARAVREQLPSLARPVFVCCGTGFNGGDGLCAARHLYAWGYRLHVAVAGRLDRLRAEPATYATILQRLGVALTEVTDSRGVARCESWLAESGLVIDALLGIGVTGSVREPMGSLISRMNGAQKPVVAVDIPSGLHGDTGVPQGIAVKATVTVSFGLAKRGCFAGAGPSHVGRLVVDGITIPQTLLEAP